MSVIATANDIREQAAQRFAQLGWPSTKLEEWKYTNVAPIARVNWRFDDVGRIDDVGRVLNPSAPSAAEGGHFAAADELKSRPTLVFVNGRGAISATSHP